MNPMLNLCEGHAFVELNYPHIIGISGYERHHEVASWVWDSRKNPVSRNTPGVASIVPNRCDLMRANNGEPRADHAAGP
jgi:hypothetical protein